MTLGRRDPLVTKMWVLTAGVAIADSVFGAVFVTHMLDRALSPGMIGALLMIPAVTSVLVEAPSGALGDRYGHKRLAWMGLAAWAVGLGTFAVARDAVVFAVAIAIWAVGLAIYSGTVVALVATRLSSTDRAASIEPAVRGSEVARWLAAACAALVVVVGAARVDLSVLIGCSAVLLAVQSLWVAFGWPETTVRSDHRLLAGLRHGVTLILGPGERGLAVFAVLTGVGLSAIILTWQPYALDVLGLDKKWLGVAMFVLSIGAALGAALARTTSKLAPSTVVAAALAALGGCLVAVLAGGVVGAVGFVGAEVAVGWALATQATWAQRYLPDGARATAGSVLGTLSGVTIALANGAVGQMWQWLGLVTAIAVVGVTVTVLAAAGGLVAAQRRRSRRR